MRVHRRSFLGGLARATMVSASGKVALAATGALDAATLGLRPGSPDDQSALLGRLAQRAAREARPLFLPPGRYVATDVSLPPGSRLVGVAGLSKLVAASPTRPILRAVGGEARFEGLVLEGIPGPPSRETALLVCQDIAQLVLADCAFSLAPGIGAMLTRCGGRVVDCRFEAMGDAALFALDSSGLAIVGNTVARCGNNGIQVWRSSKGDDATRIAGNRVSDIRAVSGGSGQNGNGVSLFRAGGCIVEGNIIRRVAYTAVRANQAANLQMLANNAADCGEVALYVEFGFDGAIVANNLVERSLNGVSVTNYDQGGRLAVVQGNVLRKLRRAILPQGGEGGGVGIHVEAETVVTGNIVEEADDIGLSLGWGEALKDVIATGNLVRGAGQGIAVSVAPGAGKALIADNLIAGAWRGAIAAKEWDRVVAPDLTRDGASRYPNLTISGNRVA